MNKLIDENLEVGAQFVLYEILYKVVPYNGNRRDRCFYCDIKHDCTSAPKCEGRYFGTNNLNRPDGLDVVFKIVSQEIPTQPKLTEAEYLYQINVILSKLGLFYMEQFYSDNIFTWLFSQYKGKKGNLAELTFAYDFSTIEATFYFNDSESKLTNMSFEEIYSILAKKL